MRAIFSILVFIVLLLGVGPACTPRIKTSIKNAKVIEVSKLSATVVLDAGHGGADGGAVGSFLKEKDVTLDIALRVKRLLNMVMPNVRVVLTRDSDAFVSLEERVNIANKAKGDIFLSLHINSSKDKEARGFEVYSLDIANDRHAKRLAALENKKHPKSALNFVLADLRANDFRAESDRLARIISQGLSAQLAKKVERSLIKDRGQEQAIFQVLFVDMPAVLTELFFISNLEDEKLMSEIGPKMCAQGLVVGIKAFLENRNLRAQHAKKSQ